jgi:hypothetical protein
VDWPATEVDGWIAGIVVTSGGKCPQVDMFFCQDAEGS